MSESPSSTLLGEEPFPISPGASETASPIPKDPILLSLGTRMMLLTGLVLIGSFCLCAAVTFSLARHMLQSDLQVRVARESNFLATASRDLISRNNPNDRAALMDLAKHLVEQPEILAVNVMDGNRHIVAHTSKRGITVPVIFSLQVAIRSGARVAGSVRAWYSPGLALQEFWNTTGDLVLLLFGGTLAVFALSLFFVNEWVLNRPFRQFFAAIDEANHRHAHVKFREDRHDEWGALSSRLNQFLSHLSNLQERSSVLYETSRLLGTPAGIRESLEGVFTGILHRYNLSACLILIESDEKRLRAEFAAGVSMEFARSVTVEHGQGVAGITYASGQPRLMEDIHPAENDPLISALAERQPVRSALFVPLAVDGRILGTAAYFSRVPRAFQNETVDSLTGFTNHVAIALRNRRKVSDLQAVNQRLESEVVTILRELQLTNQRLVNRVRELKTVYELALATAASTNVEDIIRVIIGGIKELVEVQGGAFFMFDPSSGILEPIPPAFDQVGSSAGSFRCRVEESPLLRQVIEKGQPHVLNFVDPADPLPASWRALSVRSLLALPLRQEDEVKGVFCVVNKVNGLFSEDDVRLLSLLTNRVTEVLNRLGLDQQLRQRVNDLSVLQEIGSQLPSPPVLADTVAAIGRITRHSLSGLELCLFFLHHSASDALAMMGGDWDPRLNLDVRALTYGVSEKTPLAECFRENRPAYYHGDIPIKGSPWENDTLLQATAMAELMYLPLTVEQGTIGVLAIGSRQPGTLTAEIRRLAGLIANQVAIVIERARLYESLRSANEKLEQINHLKNEFISMVSHELRTPLTTIKGFVSIVLNEETGPLNAQQQRFLETSDRAIDRLTLLVSDLLDISRIEAGQIKMQLRPVTVREIIERLATSFAPQLKAQNLFLNVEIGEHLPRVMADPDRIAQVLDNLLTNALKFTTKGGISISTADKGDFVMISVKDTGSGIPKAEQDRIFEKFYQVKVGNAWPSKGTGLGLAIVRSIVESHRGKVWVESEAAKGADFRFLLPRARTEVAEPPVTGQLQ